MTEEGITAVAIHDTLVARCSYLPSMREEVRNDPHIVWGDSDPPDLSDQPESGAKSALDGTVQQEKKKHTIKIQKLRLFVEKKSNN
ncbi:hypothetical protein VP01_2459g2 [Puccinia sorghi]|uniref:Uncharacterized protein n=1 Tax=Puccinia sorghi TaxID=27349 RepID=A0A0L6V658_9BASI|nr:hypothetical protein VP01_2459g2 [Puccinia sorghi]